MLPRQTTTFPYLPLLLILALSGCAPTVPQPTLEAVSELDLPLAVDPDVVIGVLDNGMRYVIRANAKPEKAGGVAPRPRRGIDPGI